MDTLDPSTINAAWLEVAGDADQTILHPEARKILTKASWNQSHFEKLCSLINENYKTYSSFFNKNDYSWAVQRDSYYFIPEPYYQAIALDVLIGNWFLDKKRKIHPSAFHNICTRQTASWNLQKYSPRKIFSHKNIHFITVPYIWDEATTLLLAGFIECVTLHGFLTGPSWTASLCSNTFKPAHSYWNSLIIRSLAGNVRKSKRQVHLPLYIKILKKKIPALADTLLFIPKNDNPTLLCLSYLAIAFSIAHEVGHQMTPAANMDYKKIHEEYADYYAIRGLLYCNTTFKGILDTKIDVTAHCLISGYLFFISLLIIQYSNSTFNSTEPISKNALQLRRKIIKRIKVFTNNIFKFSKTNPQHSIAFESCARILPHLVNYSNAFIDYADALAPNILNKAFGLLRP